MVNNERGGFFNNPLGGIFVVFEEGFVVETKGFTDILNVTPQVERIVSASGVQRGIVLVFTPGSTAGLTTIEYEPGAVSDLKDAVARIAPEGIAYAHDARWGDGNGFSHVRAALLGPSLSLPVRGGALVTGTWQQIVLVDFDNRPRSRRVEVQVVGDNP